MRTHHLTVIFRRKTFSTIRHENVTTSLFPIRAGVPQGSVLGPILYLIYTADLPTSNDVITATYADDTAILAVNKSPVEATILLQNSLHEIEKWANKWRIQ